MFPSIHAPEEQQGLGEQANMEIRRSCWEPVHEVGLDLAGLPDLGDRAVSMESMPATPDPLDLREVQIPPFPVYRESFYICWNGDAGGCDIAYKGAAPMANSETGKIPFSNAFTCSKDKRGSRDVQEHLHAGNETWWIQIFKDMRGHVMEGILHMQANFVFRKMLETAIPGQSSWYIRLLAKEIKGQVVAVACHKIGCRFLVQGFARFPEEFSAVMSELLGNDPGELGKLMKHKYAQHPICMILETGDLHQKGFVMGAIHYDLEMLCKDRFASRVVDAGVSACFQESDSRPLAIQKFVLHRILSQLEPMVTDVSARFVVKTLVKRKDEYASKALEILLRAVVPWPFVLECRALFIEPHVA